MTSTDAARIAAMRRRPRRPGWRHVPLHALKERIEHPGPPFISPPWPNTGSKGILSFGFYLQGSQD
jgi:hypothetical protein